MNNGKLDKLSYLWDACASLNIPEESISKYLYIAMNVTSIAFRNQYERDYATIAANLYQWDVLRKVVNPNAR